MEVAHEKVPILTRSGLVMIRAVLIRGGGFLESDSAVLGSSLRSGGSALRRAVAASEFRTI